MLFRSGCCRRHFVYGLVVPNEECDIEGNDSKYTDNHRTDHCSNHRTESCDSRIEFRLFQMRMFRRLTSKKKHSYR